MSPSRSLIKPSTYFRRSGSRSSSSNACSCRSVTSTCAAKTLTHGDASVLPGHIPNPPAGVCMPASRLMPAAVSGTAFSAASRRPSLPAAAKASSRAVVCSAHPCG